MSTSIRNLTVKNFRSLADVSIDLGPINVIFGPNGTGKSSFLDSIWFIRDCAIRGVESASAKRSHGIGILHDMAEEGGRIEISASTNRISYNLQVGFASGRIDPLLGERLFSIERNKVLIERSVGSDKIRCLNSGTETEQEVALREPQKLSLEWFLNFDPRFEEAQEFDRLFRFTHFYDSRSFNFFKLRQYGSEAGHETWLWDRADNLWSVLRNLQGMKARDSRYDTIMNYMRKAHPRFQDLVIETTGPVSVYASFIEKERAQEIRASGVSDGHLQLLILLTALFGDIKGKEGVLMFDEPETSLHPHALAVLAEAMQEACEGWGRQVILATHSPALISQFDSSQIFQSGYSESSVVFQRLDAIENVQDLLNDYNVGSLYMAEAVGSQSALQTP